VTEYDLRISNTSFNEEDWSQVTRIRTTSPRSSGQPESFRVGGLDPSSAYLLAIKAADEVPNWSGISNYASTTTFDEAPPELELVWGSHGSNENQFDAPMDVSVFQGLVYVADWNNHRIQAFDENGQFRFTIGESQLSKSFHMSNDAQGSLFVADSGYVRIVVFDQAGQETNSWILSHSPSSIFVQGEELSVSMWNDVVRFTTAGAPLPGLVLRYPEQPQITNLSSGTNDSWVVLFSDPQVSSYNGDQLVSSWGSSGTGLGFMNHPKDLAVDQDGNILVADTGNQRIQKFSATGRFLAAWGRPGPAPGEFARPVAIALQEPNVVYVADSGNDRIQKFRWHH